VKMGATHVNHMQNALDQMNLPLHHVISDITGLTDLAIIDAILSGERNPFILARLRHERIKASEEAIAKSLVGDYRIEHLFTLRQSLTAYRSYQQLIDYCDRETRRSLDTFQPPQPPADSNHEPESKKRPASADAGLRTEFKRVFGLDLTKVPRIGRHRTDAVRRDRAGVHEVSQCLGVCVLDGFVPGQRHQRRKGAMSRYAQGQVPRGYFAANGRTVTPSQQVRAGAFLSSNAREARRTKSHHRQPAQTRTHHLSPGDHSPGVR